MIQILRTKHDTRFGLILLLATLLTGMGQLLCMIALQRSLDADVFSQVSLVIGFFTFYVIFVDLGLQSDLVRRLATSRDGDASTIGNHDADGVVGLRTLGAVVGIGSACISVFINNSSPALILGLVLMMIGLFPLANLFTLEASSLANRNLRGALRARFGKITGILYITICFVYLQNIMPAEVLFATAFGGYTFIQVLFTLGSQYKRVSFNFESALSEFQRSWNLICHRSLVAMVGILFLNLQVDIHSETKLSEFNMAQSMIAPLSIMIQIVISMSASRLFVTNDRKLNSIQIIALTTAVLIFHLVFASVLSLPYFIQVAFPGLNPGIFSNHLVPLTFHSFFALISSFQLLYMQHHSQKWQAVVTGLVGLIALWIGYGLVRFSAPDHSSWMICFSHFASIILGFFLIIGTRKSRLDKIAQ